MAEKSEQPRLKTQCAGRRKRVRGARRFSAAELGFISSDGFIGEPVAALLIRSPTGRRFGDASSQLLLVNEIDRVDRG
jgi:hypothetical protein